MTGYDVFVILVLLASGAAGWFRGGVRELTAFFSFFLAGLLALITLPWTAPFGRSLVDPDWAGSVLAVGLTFLILYFGLRFLGAAISKGARGKQRQSQRAGPAHGNALMLHNGKQTLWITGQGLRQSQCVLVQGLLLVLVVVHV